MKSLFRYLGGVTLLLSLAACSEAESPNPPQAKAAPAAAAKPVSLETGERLFRQHCAQCHGENAQGDPNWRKLRPDGSFPPPPLNGTGHAWHHSMAVLKATIRDGTARLGGTMPAWGDKLTEAEIEAIIRWFQSKWPPDIYARWQELDRR